MQVTRKVRNASTGVGGGGAAREEEETEKTFLSRGVPFLWHHYLGLTREGGPFCRIVIGTRNSDKTDDCEEEASQAFKSVGIPLVWVAMM